MIKSFMKKIDKQVWFSVLGVHIAILLLLWGGLSALGVAFVLSIPFVGGTTWLAYQHGKECRGNTKRVIKEVPLGFHLFRG